MGIAGLLMEKSSEANPNTDSCWIAGHARKAFRVELVLTGAETRLQLQPPLRVRGSALAAPVSQ